MGNRHSFYQLIERINPQESPYLHVYSSAYAPVVGFPFVVRIAATHQAEKLDEIVMQDILPPLRDPPQELYARDHVTLIVAKLFDRERFLERLHAQPTANSLHILHSAKWGYAFVETIAFKLADHGYVIDMDRIASLGRNKRIQHHQLPLYRD